MDVSIHVCKGKSCGPKGGRMLLRDIEELCEGRAQVGATDCLGLCGLGPNVKIVKDRVETMHKGNVSFETVEHLIADNVGPVNSLRSKFGRLKFAIRRDHRAQVRKDLLRQCFELVEGRGSAFSWWSGGSSSSQSPSQQRHLAELLALRSQEYSRAAAEDSKAAVYAVDDASRAVALEPNWPHAHRVLAGALDVSGQFSQAAKRLRIAMDMGHGLDPDSTTVQISRLEKGISKREAGAVEIHLDEAPLHWRCRGDHEYEIDEPAGWLSLLTLPTSFGRCATVCETEGSEVVGDDQFGNLNFYSLETKSVLLATN